MTRGWLVVAACFLVALYSWGFGFYAHGIYLVELRRAQGWSTSLISTVVTLHYVASALLLPYVAVAIERLGPRPVFLTGLACTLLPVAALPLVTEPWQLGLAYAVLAIGWATTSVAPIAAIVGQWFDARRGLALNLALSGATVSGLAIAPVLLLAIQAWGFLHGVAWFIAAATFIVGLAVVAMVRSGPPPGPSHPDARPLDPDATVPAAAAVPTKRAALASRRFWSIAGPYALALMAQVGFLTHLVPMLTEGLGPAAGAGRGGGVDPGRVDPGLALAIATIMGLAGRVGFGFVLDRVPQRAAAAFFFLNQVAALCALLLVAEPAWIYLACAAYGVSVGNNITIAPLIVQREYDAAAFPMLVALSTAVIQLAYAFGAALLGILRDLSGSYAVPLWVCAGLNAAAAVWIVLRPVRVAR